MYLQRCLDHTDQYQGSSWDYIQISKLTGITCTCTPFHVFYKQLTQFCSLLLPLELKLLQPLFLFLCFGSESEVCPGLYSVVVGGLKRLRRDVATVDDLVNVETNVLGSSH